MRIYWNEFFFTIVTKHTYWTLQNMTISIKEFSEYIILVKDI
jgi:hypothetical protein